MFYAMIFDTRDIIDYIINEDLFKIEYILGLLLDVKGLEKPFNILPELTSALDKLRAGMKSTKFKMTADEVYALRSMYPEYQSQYIEYLWLKFLEEKNDKQKAIIYNYISLVKGITTGFFVNKNDNDARPERLFEMAFDKAQVEHKLANLGDRRIRNTQKRIIRLSDTRPKTLGERFVNWLKNDWNKKYRWEE